MKLNNQTIRIKNTKDSYLYQFQTRAENTHNAMYIKCENLRQCYSSYSDFKEKAFQYCINIVNYLKECKQVKIINHGISGKNIFQFTYTINAYINNMLVSFYITRDNNKIIADKNTIKTLLNTLECLKTKYDNIYLLD